MSTVMRRLVGCGLVAVIAVGMFVALSGASVEAAGGGWGDCPRQGIECPMIYDPVTCDGVTYSNSCVAWVACAENCEPGNPGS